MYSPNSKESPRRPVEKNFRRQTTFPENLAGTSTIDLIRSFNSKKQDILPSEKPPVEPEKPAFFLRSQTMSSLLKKEVHIPQVRLIEDEDTLEASRNEILMNDFFENSSIENYEIIHQLGHGAYSTVWQAIHKPTNNPVALKSYDRMKLLKAHRNKNVTSEVTILKSLDHPSIVKVYEQIETPREIHISMEYIEGSSLKHYLKTRRLEEDEVKSIFREIVLAIRYCHSKSVTHRDLKLDNILITHQKVVKIIDFGFSTCHPPLEKIRLFCGTPRYMAPEIVMKKEYAGPPADVWALGVVLYALLCGNFPFKGHNDRDLFEKIETGQFILPKSVSHGARLVVEKMLKEQPERRVGLNELLLDEWMIPAVEMEPTIKEIMENDSEEEISD